MGKINKSFLVLFFKKELLFEKRSKNFYSLALVALLAACAAPPATYRVHIAPSLDLALPPPGALGRTLEATQLVTAHYRNRTLVFEGHISTRPDQVLLVVFDAFGRTALSVTWSDSGLTYTEAPWLPAIVRPQNMLADVVVLYWPEQVVRDALQASGATLVTTTGARVVTMDRREIIRAEYQPAAPGETWAGHARYRNLPWGYDLDIESVISP